jgi:hypothetical protein
MIIASCQYIESVPLRWFACKRTHNNAEVLVLDFEASGGSRRA